MTRKPMAFPLASDPPPPSAGRAPRSLKPAAVTPDTVDAFAEEVMPSPPAPRRASRLGALFFGALGVLASLALGLWTDRLVRDLFARADWLGWLALATAGLAAAALLAIIARELAGLMRLSAVAAMQARAETAMAASDGAAARTLASEVAAMFAARPETAAGRRLLADQRDEIIDGTDLLQLAEIEVLGPVDARAKALVTAAARRVSVVTALSPRAFIDVGYVLYEAARLIGALSRLYGGRPGVLGFVRLVRSVLAHLAVTGTIAAGDTLVQQLVGQGLAARLSARLGEGVVNGMMTARIGIAAIETTRPLPFLALKRPGLAEVVASFSDLASAGKAGEKDTS